MFMSFFSLFQAAFVLVLACLPAELTWRARHGAGAGQPIFCSRQSAACAQYTLFSSIGIKLQTERVSNCFMQSTI